MANPIVGTTSSVAPNPEVRRLPPLPEPETPQVPRDPITAGIAGTLALDELLQAYGAKKEAGYTGGRVGNYHFSGLAKCFRKAWYEAKNTEPDPGSSEYATGDAEAGNAVEERFIEMYRAIYGREGVLLKNIRMTRVVKVGEDSVVISGRNDPAIVGDNLRIKEFTEFKSQKFMPKKMPNFIEGSGLRRVPLSMVGIDAPNKTDGLATFNHAIQLAMGVKILRDEGIKIDSATLNYVLRANFENHLTILFTPADVELLYSIGEWWAVENHTNLKQDTPPAPNYFMGYECNYCPFAQQCEKRSKEAKEIKSFHPVVLAVNERIVQANTLAMPSTVVAQTGRVVDLDEPVPA